MLNSIPSSAGSVRSVQPSGSVRSPFVLLIQDARGFKEAENNLQKILSSAPREAMLMGQRGEGLDEEADSAHAISRLRSDRGRAEMEAWLEKAEKGIERIKGSHLNPKLREAEALVSGQEDGSGKMTDFIRRAADKMQGFEGRFPKLHRLLLLTRMEESIDFARAGEEREEVLENLSHALAGTDREKLARWSLAYRAGHIRHAEFYGKVENILNRSLSGWKRHGAFKQYLEYVRLSDQVHPAEVLGEMKGLKAALLELRVRNGEEREVLDLVADLRLVRKLAGHRLAPEDWTLYMARKENIFAIGGRMKKFGEEVPALPETLADAHEKFYDAGSRRNSVIVRRMLGKMRPCADSPHPTGLLVAGGFHLPGLERELAMLGVSYAVVAPHLGPSDIPKESIKNPSEPETGERTLALGSEKQAPAGPDAKAAMQAILPNASLGRQQLQGALLSILREIGVNV